jgi:hypothetical protein
MGLLTVRERVGLGVVFLDLASGSVGRRSRWSRGEGHHPQAWVSRGPCGSWIQRPRRIATWGPRGAAKQRSTKVNHGAPRTTNLQLSAVIGRDEAAGPYMACKGSGVQIPSAPPQVNGPLRRRPPANRPPQAANRQQPALKADPASGTAAPPVSIAGVVAQ